MNLEYYTYKNSEYMYNSTMVLSRLNKDIDYKESSAIDPDDVHHTGSTYNIVFENVGLDGGGNKKDPITVMFGKKKYTHSHKGIVHFIVYLVVNQCVKCPIGVYETPEASLLKLLDEDGDLDPNKIEVPLLYKHVNNHFIETMYDSDSDSSSSTSSSSSSDEGEGEKEKDDDIFTVKVPKNFDGGKKDDTIKIDVNKVQIQQLPEESAQDAKSIREAYSPAPNDIWLVQFMKNKKYKIDTMDQHDSLFIAVKLALEQIGNRVSVQKMRNKLANEAVDEMYQEHRRAYLLADDVLRKNAQFIDESKVVLKELKQRLKNARNNDERTAIVNEANVINTRIIDRKSASKDISDFIKRHIGYMEDVKSFPDFQEYIRSSTRYRPDKWDISTLERVLNVKLVIFHEDAYKEDALDYILDCGRSSDDLLAPTHYILLSENRSKYDLVSYKGKKIFMYREIPYDIKRLILNKYMECNAGTFGKIQDFRNLISKLGLPLDIQPTEAEDKSAEFDPEIVLSLQSNSPSTALPGQVSCENIPMANRVDFINLSKVKDWRRKLDGSWPHAPFKVDNHKWASVDHYYNASKYKKGYPDFYMQFSLDSDSALSKDPVLAKKVGSKEKHELKPKHVRIDPDFYNGRNITERNLATEAKFASNPDMRNILSSTRNAKLIRVTRGGNCTICNDIMRIRNSLTE